MSRGIESPNALPEWESSLRVLEEHSMEFDLHHPETGEVISVIFTPSIFTNDSPLSLQDIDIRLVTTSQLVRHELFLQKGLNKVSFSRNGYYEWNDAPMVGVINSDRKIMIIDGSTRLGRIQDLSEYVIEKHHPRHTPVFPVQIVDYEDDALVLDIWEKYHLREKMLTKQRLVEMVLAGEFVEPKQTKFGVRIGNRILSIAQTQGEVGIAMSLLLGINLMPEDVTGKSDLIYHLR